MGSDFQNNQIIRHIYIHVPFCKKKCDYCSFYSENHTLAKVRVFLENLQNEIKLFSQKFQLIPKPIYFGGGTPSLLSAKQIQTIISKFNLTEIEEITLECNPATLDEKYILELAETAVNRISLGAQSFLNAELRNLGRLHNSLKINESFQLLRKHHFNNISLDLIYGLPHQTQGNVAFSLEKIINLQPEHISIYCLSLEKDVPLFRQKQFIPTDEKVADFYHLIREKLIKGNFHQYEISNFSKNGFASKHNLAYWQDKHYLGVGPTAAGYFGKNKKKYRYQNLTNLQNWQTNDFNETNHEVDFILTGLRKTEGINLTEFKQKFEITFIDKYVNILKKHHRYFTIENNYIKFQPRAYFISNEILMEFI